MSLGKTAWKSKRFKAMKLKPAGFTAIELLVAASLAAMMSVAMMGILRSMSAQRRVLMEYRTPRTWQTLLATQLQQDLSHSEYLSWQPGEIRLTGLGATDPMSGEPLHRRAEITYLVRKMGKTFCLLRSERPTTDALSKATRVDLVCTGVRVLEIRPLQTNSEEIDWASLGLEDESSRNTPTDEATGFEMAIPHRLRIAIRVDEKSEPLFDEVISSR